MKTLKNQTTVINDVFQHMRIKIGGVGALPPSE